MNRRAVSIFLAFVLSVSIAMFFVQCSFAHTPVPPQVVVIAVKDAHNTLLGLANAFLVDRSRRIFATAAHVVDGGRKFTVVIGNKFYAVQASSRDTSWLSDCAIVRWADKRTPSLPEAVVLGGLPDVGEPLTTFGYQFNVSDDMVNTWSPYERMIRSKVVDPVSGFGITTGSQIDVFKVLITLKEYGVIPRSDVKKLYKHYIWVDSDIHGIANNEFGEGLSGSPTYTHNSRVVGFDSASNHINTLLVPAQEIRKLLEKKI